MLQSEKGIIDESVKDTLLHLPTADIARLVFPSHPVRCRGVMASPFREDRRPSFSCYRGRGGIGMWKDHSTGEAGDNIAFYRKAFPELTYIEAVDRLAMLTLGRPALNSSGGMRRAVQAATAIDVSVGMEPEKEGALRILEVLPLSDTGVPQPLRDYWRGRGISDSTMELFGCRCVVFENLNVAGRPRLDPDSGIPIRDRDGSVEVCDGRKTCIGMLNDIGGWSLREPDRPDGSRGFKGCSSSFITTFLSGCRMPSSPVSLEGEGTGLVSYVRYDAQESSLWINAAQRFTGIAPESLVCACPFVYGFVGQRLTVRDSRRIASVLSSLQEPISGSAVCVEGMFDGLSVGELNRWRGLLDGGSDIVILNSVGNIRWAVPFISRHRKVSLMLDNDMLSGAGQKACDRLRDDVISFCDRAGMQRPAVIDGSRLFEGYKDVNDALMASKGFAVRKQGYFGCRR